MNHISTLVTHIVIIDQLSYLPTDPLCFTPFLYFIHVSYCQTNDNVHHYHGYVNQKHQQNNLSEPISTFKIIIIIKLSLGHDKHLFKNKVKFVYSIIFTALFYYSTLKKESKIFENTESSLLEYCWGIMMKKAIIYPNKCPKLSSKCFKMLFATSSFIIFGDVNSIVNQARSTLIAETILLLLGENTLLEKNSDNVIPDKMINRIFIIMVLFL